MGFSTLFRPLLAMVVAALLPVMAVAAGPQNLDARGVALHGYDPVACFVDGKLYLNLSPAVQKRWQEDITGFIGQATKNCLALKNQ